MGSASQLAKKELPISKGGTNAYTAAQARANLGIGEGGAPLVVTPGNGLTGAVDGENDTFVIDSGAPSLLQLFRNGQLQDTFSESPDYALAGDTITYVTPPSEGDDLIGYIWA